MIEEAQKNADGVRLDQSTRKQECLVLLAHGSKDPRWRLPFEQILSATRAEVGEGRVLLAYMEFMEPSLLDAARTCVGQGTLRLKIFPLFLAMGAHIANDVPRQAEELHAQFPGIEVEVLTPIGEDPRMTRLIQQIVVEKMTG